MIWTYIATALVALLIGLTGGWQVQEWRHKAAIAEQIAEDVQRLRVAAKTVDVAATGHETDKAQIRARYRTIEREVANVVENPSYSQSCLNVDGLRILAHAITGTATPSEPSPTLRGTDTSTGRNGEGGAGVGGGDSQAVPGMPEPAQPNR